MLLPLKQDFFTFSDDTLIVYFKVIPNSKKSCITEINEEFIKIKLTALALENKANNALIKYLSKLLNISKSSIEIISGERNRYKSVKICNYSHNQLLKILGDL